MAKSRKPADERRAQIVDVTLDLLNECAVEHLSTSLIASKVGVTQAALFRHFPTKNDLWAAVLKQIRERARVGWARALAAGTSPTDRLRRILMEQMTLIAETPAVPALIFSTGKFAAEDRIRPIHTQIMLEFRTLLLAEIEQAMARGDLSADIPAPDAATLLMGLLQGLVLRWTLSGHAFDLPGEGGRLVDLQLTLLGCKTGEAAA